LLYHFQFGKKKNKQRDIIILITGRYTDRW